MTRSFYAIPAAFCLAAAVVTVQVSAQDRPAGNTPAAEQPAAQQPTTPRPANPPSAQPARPADPSAQVPARPAEPSSMSSANRVTYTGCIKPGTTTGTFVLDNAELATRPGASSPGTVGTSGAKTMSFDLEPAASVNLKAHANHKVELVGTLSDAKGTAEAPPSAAPPSSAPGAATAHAARQQFNVQSLKMVSSTCP